MKISRRSGISQSLDLFIIIAAVLAVGGIVTATIFGLIGSATTNSSVQVVAVSLTGGTSATASPAAFAITIKNTGTSTITCTPSTCTVTFAGTNTGSTAASCSAPCTITSSPSGWAIGGGTNSPLSFNAGNTTLTPGAQTTLVLDGPLTLGTNPSGMPVQGSGVAQTLSIIMGTASASASVQP